LRGLMGVFAVFKWCQLAVLLESSSHVAESSSHLVQFSRFKKKIDFLVF
jgi:hypothetical protein